MASAYIEYAVAALPAPAGLSSGAGSSVHGKCAASEVLTISGTQADGTVAGAAGKTYARITTDTACWVAIGSAPDTTATVATATSNARRVMLAVTSIDVALGTGQKVSVKALS